MAYRGSARALAAIARQHGPGRKCGFSAAAGSLPSPASHGGLPPKQHEHYMTDVLKKNGANFLPGNDDYGWVPYYGGDAAPKWELPKDNPTPGWVDHVMGEATNALNNCAVDLPVFGVLDVQGPKAFEFLDRTVTKKPSRIAGNIRLGYTATTEGTLWNDVSMATRGENDVYFIGLGGFGKYEMDEMTAKRDALGYTADEVRLTNQSYDQQLMHIFGPKAPKILSEVLGPEILDVPFFKFRKINAKGIPLEAFSMSYAAIPGWELHVPKEYAPQLYDMLLSHPLSKAESFKPCGSMGIQSFRTETWFRGTPDVKGVCHYKGGLIEKAVGKHEFWGSVPDDFKPDKQMMVLKVDAPKGYEWSMFGARYPVFQNGQQVGETLHSAFAIRSQACHAFCLVDAKTEGAGKTFAIHAHGKEMPGVQLAEPLAQSTFRDR